MCFVLMSRRVSGCKHHTLPRKTTSRLPLMLACLAAVFISLPIAGCGPAHGGLPEQDYKKAETALKKALAAWKSGEPAKKWSSKKSPVRFVDDSWKKGDQLVDYAITTIRANTDGFPEAIVKLTVKPAKGGEQRTVEALYGINVKKADQVSIGRDPMY